MNTRKKPSLLALKSADTVMYLISFLHMSRRANHTKYVGTYVYVIKPFLAD